MFTSANVLNESFLRPSNAEKYDKVRGKEEEEGSYR